MIKTLAQKFINFNETPLSQWDIFLSQWDNVWDGESLQIVEYKFFSPFFGAEACYDISKNLFALAKK